MTKIACAEIKEGVLFNQPVFFDDGVNMFLAANHPAKRYHISVLKRWNVPFLLTDGRILNESENEELLELEEL